MASASENVPISSQLPKEPVVATESQKLVDQTMSKKVNTVIYFVYFVLILLGVGTGYLLHRNLSGGKGIGSGEKVTMTKTEKVEGLNDAKTFADPAEGIVEKGGVDTEGTHKLIREGGPSKTVALVSSVLDLDDYIGKKVTVWGQTFPPQKAGWFMDVGKIELRE